MNRIHLRKHNRIVVKLGTSTLTYANGRLNLRRIEKFSRVLSDLRNQEKDIILVSSGAIAVGADRLGLAERPRDIRGKQAASAVGQAALMQIYERFFMEYNQKVAQILLTRDVLEHDIRKQNAINTFHTLFSLDVVPIVNENDTISTDELGFSDNDSLSAFVACLVESDCLIILSDIDGLYDRDPNQDESAHFITTVEHITTELESGAGDASSQLGTGGMAAKIAAARIATGAGIDTVIANGSNPDNLFKILDGEEVGTLFMRQDSRR